MRAGRPLVLEGASSAVSLQREVAGPAGFEPAAFGFVVRAIPSCHSTPHSDKAVQRGPDRAYPSRFRHAVGPRRTGRLRGPTSRAGSGWTHGADLARKIAVRAAVAVIVRAALRGGPLPARDRRGDAGAEVERSPGRAGWSPRSRRDRSTGLPGRPLPQKPDDPLGE